VAYTDVVKGRNDAARVRLGLRTSCGSFFAECNCLWLDHATGWVGRQTADSCGDDKVFSRKSRSP